MFLDPVERAERTHAADIARVDAFRREEAEYAADCPGDDDFEAHIAHEDALALIRRKIVVAEGVAESSANRLATERTKAEAEQRRNRIAAQEAASADWRHASSENGRKLLPL